MKVPGFQYPGGKSLVRDRVISTFPRAGRTYLEPFAGRGNIFFGARAAKLLFSRWWINDVSTASFFHALREVDLRELPEKVDREIYDRLKADRTSAVSLVVEPRITFFGGGYDASFQGPSARDPGYRRSDYAKRVLAARRLLQHAEVTDLSWEKLPWGELDHRDFVYLDPPYLGTDVGYGQVDHEALVDLLAEVKFRWVLSGYDSELYRRKLGAPVTFERPSEMGKINGRGKAGHRTECLWSNRWKRIA